MEMELRLILEGALLVWKGALMGDKDAAEELNDFFALMLEVAEAGEILTLNPYFW